MANESRRGKKRKLLASTSRVQGEPSIRHLISSRAGSRILAEQNLMVLSIPSIPGICIPADQPQILHLSLLCSDTTITASFPSAASSTIPSLRGKYVKKKEKKVLRKKGGKQTFSSREFEPEGALSGTDGRAQPWPSIAFSMWRLKVLIVAGLKLLGEELLHTLASWRKRE